MASITFPAVPSESRAGALAFMAGGMCQRRSWRRWLKLEREYDLAKMTRPFQAELADL